MIVWLRGVWLELVVVVVLVVVLELVELATYMNELVAAEWACKST